MAPRERCSGVILFMIALLAGPFCVCAERLPTIGCAAMARASLALSLPAESLVDLLETDPVDWTRVVFTWPPPCRSSTPGYDPVSRRDDVRREGLYRRSFCALLRGELFPLS